MVVAMMKSGLWEIIANKDDDWTFDDMKSADAIAEKFAMQDKIANTFVVEAVSRHHVPTPKVIKQNLHIPLLQARDSEAKPNE